MFFIRHVGETLENIHYCLLRMSMQKCWKKKYFFARDTIGKDGIVCPGTRGTWWCKTNFSRNSSARRRNEFF